MCPDVFSMSCCERSRNLFVKPWNTAPGAKGSRSSLAAQDGLCRVPQLVKTPATAAMGRTDNISRVGFAAPQQRGPSFSPGNLSYKPQPENGKKKWKCETMAGIAGRFQTDKYFSLTTIPVLESSSIKHSARPSHPRTINTKTYFNSCFHHGQYQRIETSYRSTYILMYCGVIYCAYKDYIQIYFYFNYSPWLCRIHF